MRAMELLGMLYSSLKDSLSRSTAAADRLYAERIGQGVETEEVPRPPLIATAKRSARDREAVRGDREAVPGPGGKIFKVI